MKRIVIFALSLTLCLGATIGVCIERLSPFEVAEKFWAAIKADDRATIHKYIASKSLKGDDLTSSLLPIEDFKLDKTTIKGDRAWIETIVVVRSEEPVDVLLETMLIREEGQWKVLYGETIAMITEASDLARALESFQELTEKFAQKFDKSLDELQRSLPKVERELKEIEKKLKAEIPGIKNRLEGLAKELEDLFNSLKQDPPPEKGKAI
jgi:hypothetical protein